MDFGAMRWVCCVLLVAVAYLATDVEAELVTQNWTISYITAAPDCYLKTIIGINKGYPGPLISARQGDTVQIYMTNKLNTEGVTMHWHDWNSLGRWYAAVSQCAINPGETFIYKFLVDRPGTYFYHGHYGCQRANGFYGSLIVDLPYGQKEPFEYDDEHSIILNDWWHRSVFDQQQGLDSVPFKWVGEPQSLLIEGRGNFSCSKVVNYSDGGVQCNQTDERCTPHVFSVDFNKTYRLRIASVASLSGFNFKIEGHNMTVVEADGHSVQPFVTDNLDVYSGETYSVLFTANQTANRNYWLGVNVRGRTDAFTPTGLGILNYNPLNKYDLPTTPAPKGPAWNDTATSVATARKYKALPNNPDSTTHPFSESEFAVQKSLVLLNTQSRYKDHVRWSINNVTYFPLQTPLLVSLVDNIADGYDRTPPPTMPIGPYDIYNPPAILETNAGSGVYMFQTGEIVEVILQNAYTLSNASEVHPWHLHGHDFYVLAYGDGKYDPIESPKTFNLVDPPLKNNVALFPRGWTAIRFKLDNPGAWPFHCHIEWHFELGMGVMFAHGIDKVKPLPTQIKGCGLSKKP